jgi:hypothetical protein
MRTAPSASGPGRRYKTFQVCIDLTFRLCYVWRCTPPVTRNKTIPAKKSARKHAPSASGKPTMPEKKTGTASRRKTEQRRAKEEGSRGKSARPRIRSQSESLGRISSDEANAKRCIRVMHVIGACSVCRGFCNVVHLLGDKRARCGQCCPVCNGG